jgi:Cu-Zn family superoxide dismutase
MLLLVLAGCASGPRESADAPSSSRPAAGAVAVARLAPTQGNHVTGTVTFTERGGRVHVEAEITGLAEGLHGFHIHEHGDCSAPDASSAGSHWNPLGHDHGGPDAAAGKRHVGDLGNIRAGSDGKATYDRIDGVLSLEGDASILGKSVIVHAGEDDLATQPTGNAGGRLACGVIERSN